MTPLSPVWFNVTRFPADMRLVTGVPPVASIFMTILIAFLVKILAQVLGKPLVYRPPPVEYGVIAPTHAPL